MRALHFALAASLAASPAAALDGRALADVAYQNFVARFWVGGPANGHFAILNSNSVSGGFDAPPRETEPNKGWLWSYGSAAMVPYAYWKATGDADALTRMQALTRWVKSRWTAADLATCGHVAGATAVTLDDAAWATRGLIALYDATADATMLTYAKAMFDCVYITGNRFRDPLAGGGLWYDSETISSATWASNVVTITLSQTPTVAARAGQTFVVTGATPSALNGAWVSASTSGDLKTMTYALAGGGAVSVNGVYHSGSGKSFDNMPMAMSLIRYYRAACPLEGGSCPTALGYLTQAKALADWSNRTLRRSQNGSCPQADDLFWSGVDAGAVPRLTSGSGCAQANVIQLAGSVTGLTNNFAAAAMNGALASLDYGQTHADIARATTASMTALLIDSCGAWLNDRDARAATFWLPDFYEHAYPLLTPAQSAAVRSAAFASARSVMANNHVGGQFGGDFCGPLNGAWQAAGFSGAQLETAAMGALLAITARPFFPR